MPQGGPGSPDGKRRIIWIAIAAFVIGALAIPYVFKNDTVKTISYSTLIADAQSQQVLTAAINNTTGVITGQLVNNVNYTTNGPLPVLTTEVAALRQNNVAVTFVNPSGVLSLFLPYLLWLVMIVGLFWFMNRQARGQMNGMMSVGRSKAKQFNQDRPTTTFADVAGYDGVKQEIN